MILGNDHTLGFATGGSAHVQMQLSTKECESLGLTGLALCSNCNTFPEYVKDQGQEKRRWDMDLLRCESNRSCGGIPFMYVIIVGSLGLLLGYLLKRT